MRLMNSKNLWGAQGAGIDQQRSDMFYVRINLPTVLGAAGLWDEHIGFAVKEFPFPPRTIETSPVKFLQQTNHIIGADTALGPNELTVRYSFNIDTARHLERWWWLTSNPKTGGVGLTSQVKTDGYFYYLVPNMTEQAKVEDAAYSNTYEFVKAYYLEGVILKGLTPSASNMEESNLATFTMSLQMDRYYPKNPSDLKITTLNVPGQITSFAQIIQSS